MRRGLGGFWLFGGDRLDDHHVVDLGPGRWRLQVATQRHRVGGKYLGVYLVRRSIGVGGNECLVTKGPAVGRTQPGRQSLRPLVVGYVDRGGLSQREGQLRIRRGRFVAVIAADYLLI